MASNTSKDKTEIRLDNGTIAQATAYFEEMATCDGFFDPREKDVIDKLFS